MLLLSLSLRLRWELIPTATQANMSCKEVSHIDVNGINKLTPACSIHNNNNNFANNPLTHLDRKNIRTDGQRKEVKSTFEKRP
jgi:hypothetical protein